jgi:RimJ/RimL family protein N-acetyltransferase
MGTQPKRTAEWSFRQMVGADLPDLLPVQERGSVAGIGHIFPQETHPFPRDGLHDRWRDELEDPDVATYVVVGPAGDLLGFAARRDAELLHFGTAVETWGSGLAAWLHDALVATYPPDLDRLTLRVFAENGRARRFYEKLGWRSTGRESRSPFAPHPVLVEYTLGLIGRRQ